MSENTPNSSPSREQVMCPVRRRLVTLTPEEEVRQDLIHYLHHTCGYPLELMQVEGSISIGGLNRRCDIVLYRRDHSPLAIVECKRPDVPITQKVCDQACRYNTALQVPYLLLSNGLTRIVVEVDFAQRKLRQLSEMPHWENIKC